MLVMMATCALATAAPVSAVAAGRTAPRTSVSARGPRRVAPGGVLEVAGHVRGLPLHARVSLERRHDRRWRTVMSRRAVPRYLLHLHTPRQRGALWVRVVVRRGSRRIAVSRPLRVMIARGAPTTAGAGTSATVVHPGDVTSVPAPGAAGPVVLSGSQAVDVGSVLASTIGPRTPDGFLGKVTSVTHRGGDTVVQTVPTTLQAAVPEGSIDLANATPRAVIRSGASNAPSSSAAHPRAAEPATLTQRLTKAFTCQGEASVEASGSVALTATPEFKASWRLFGGMSASFSETVRASADLSTQGAAAADCTLDKTGLFRDPKVLGRYVAFVDAVPVVIVLDGQLFLDGSVSAAGSITAGIQGSASATGGIGYEKGRFSPIGPKTSVTFGAEGPTIDAKASVGAHLTPELRILLYGAGGPVFDAKTGLDLNADISKTPWWSVTAPFTVTARLSAPVLHLDSPSLTLYSHTFDVAHAAGAFQPVPPPAPVPTPPQAAPQPAAPAVPATGVPATGPTLVYDGDSTLTAFDDLTFDDWSAATGEPADVETTLPEDLSGYRCVMLLANAALGADESTRVGNYLRSGGTVLAVGEHSGSSFSEGNATLNAFATGVGAGLSLDDDSLDAGQFETTNIDTSPLTEGVVRLGYNWASGLSVTDPAVPLAETSDGLDTLAASQTIGAGTLVMSGDSNVFNDNNYGAYASDYNDRFAKNLCP
jgi:hypothetical protein